MRNGLLNVLTYYVAGLVLTFLSYLSFDNSYAHGPSLYHLTALSTFYGGIAWTVVIGFKFLFYERTEKRKGILIGNTVILIAISMTFYFTIVRPINKESQKEINEDKLTTSINGDTTTIMHNGQIVYMKVRDSIYLDFIKTNK